MLPMADFLRRLNEQTLSRVRYARVLDAVFCGELPAEKRGGRYYLPETAIPQAVELFASKKRIAA